MAKTKFSAYVKEAIWEVWEKKCALTGHLLDIDSMHIDHLLPESLSEKPLEFDQARKKFGLNDNFDLNGYENLVPCKGSANTRKGNLLLEETIRFNLDLAKKRAPLIALKVEELKKKLTGAKAKNHLRGSLEDKKLTIQDVLETSLEYVEPLREDDPSTPQLLNLLEAIHKRVAPSSIDLRSFVDETSSDSELDREINKLRDLIPIGKCISARDGLQKLWDEIPSDTEPRIRFRIKANLGAAYLKIGDLPEAAKFHLEAYDEAPAEPKAAANRVVGLALSGRGQEAYEFAKSCLESNHDPRISCSLYTAAKMAGISKDPIDLIPKDHLADANLTICRIDYLRARDIIEWRDLAKQSLIKFPDDKDARRFAADALIDEVTSSRGFSQVISFPLEVQNNIRSAASLLQDLWDNEKYSQGRVDITIAANLCTAYRILHENGKSKEIITQALQVEPDNLMLISCRLGVAIDETDFETAESFIVRAEKSRDMIVGFVQICANTGHWNELIDFTNNINRSALENEDLIFIDSISLVASYRLGNLSQPTIEVKNLLDRYAGHPLASTILFAVADDMDDREMQVALFQGAFERANELKPVQKVMLANTAASLNQHSAIAELIGDISVEEDTEILRLLAQAFVNMHSNVKGINFAKAIVKKYPKVNYYLRIAGSIFYNAGYLDDALKCMQAALNQDQNDAQAHIGIIHIYMRQGNESFAKKHAYTIKVATLDGYPYQLIGLAQLLTRFGRQREGTELGYQTAIRNLDDPKIILLYVGIFLVNQNADLVPKIGDVISENCSVQIVDQDGKTQFVTIEKGPDRPAAGIYSPSHQLSKALLGLKREELATLSIGFGTARQLKVIDFKHKYLHLFHELLSTFNTRFPSEQGMVEVRTEKGDVGPVLDQVKNASTRGQQIFDLYKKGSAPLAVLSKLSGRGSVVEFAKQLVGRGIEIKTCLGSREEREQSIARLEETTGVVLDTYTAWLVYELGLIEIFQRLFSRVTVSRSVIDDLREWKEKYTDTTNPVMTLGYENGQFIRQEMSLDDIKATAEYIEEGIYSIEGGLEVLPAVAPGNLSPGEQQYLDLAGNHGLDAIFLCAQEDLVLVTEDIKYRAISESAFKKRGAWLQSVLIWALDSRKINIDEYLSALVKLAQSGHSFLTLNAQILVKIVEDDPSLIKFTCAAKYMCSEGADFDSHVDVIREFIVSVSGAAANSLVKAQAISILLERAADMGSRTNQLALLFSRLRNMNSCSGRQSMNSWIIGHFIFIK